MNIIKRMWDHVKPQKWGHKGMGTKVIKPMRLIGKNKIFLGDRITILNNARMEAIGENGRLTIGAGTSIEQGCHLIAANHLDIGEDCVISAWVYISDCNHIYNKEKPIMQSGLEIKRTKIGRHVFIGIGAKILPGVSIGDFSVIGANAVVTKDVPPHEVWGGIPARYIETNEILRQ